MSTSKPGIGLPKMHLEPGERRVFLPGFIAALQEMGFKVLLEKDYGASIDLAEGDYKSKADQVQFADIETIYQQEYVLVLRYPGDEKIRWLKPGACLISMLHYPTRPQRVELLKAQNLQAISLDAIMNDSKQRMVENLPSVAWNGLRISIEQLIKVYPPPGFEDPGRTAVRVTLLGAGAVGKNVIQAAVAYGNPRLRGSCSQQASRESWCRLWITT